MPDNTEPQIQAAPVPDDNVPIEDNNKQQKTTYAGIIVIIIAFMVFFGLYAFAKKEGGLVTNLPVKSVDKLTKIEKFASEEEFKKYLQDVKNLTSAAGFGNTRALDVDSANLSPQGSFGSAAQEKAVAPAPTRYSQTNVQVAGIDEPDIIKTDGENIYYSGLNNFYDGPVRPLPVMEDVVSESSEPSAGGAGSSTTTSKLIAPDSMPVVRNTVKVISAFPPSDLKKESEIEGQGEMLLAGNMLVVFSYNKITGYDVSDEKNPVSKWSLNVDQENSASIVTSRLKDGKIYLVTKTYLNEFSPCAIPVFGGGRLTISCIDIYRPGITVPTDGVMTAMLVDPKSGNIDKKISFVGSSGQSVVYMSDDFLYSTYTYSEDISLFMYKFIESEAADLFPANVLEKIKKIIDYDISNSSKLNELQNIMSQYQASLSKDERLRIENELQNRLVDYGKVHSRELEKTGIVKIDLDKFEVSGVGSVPGQPLNQFSLDEFESNLRIATTTGGSWGSTVSESFSDVYILNSKMEKTGEVLDLGVGERIYSVRFIGERGYVVTFKQIDPFYVLDLKDSKNPQKKGELKIPGFSSYLHPLKDNLILGVGQENNQVKLSIFNVSDPANPTEVEKYNLNEYWTEVSNNHHAFLNDSEKEIFFIPGGQGGYVFSYNDGLKLVKAVSDYSVKRALYINEYFYIVGDQKITVFNQSDWNSVNSLSFN